MSTFLKRLLILALTAEARAVIRKYRPKVIAVTGSVGKTSTKDAIYAALAGDHHVRRSEKSYNSEVGLPLTILGVPNAWKNPFKWLQNLFDGLMLLIFNAPYPEWLVLEVGADRPGDIRKVAAWLPVDIAVITRLPEVPVHVEYFDSPEEVIEEKASIIRALRPSGALILYADDERVLSLASRLPEGRSAPVISFGFSEKADVRAETCKPIYAESEEVLVIGTEGQVRADSASTRISILGSAGPYALMPAFAAMAVAIGLGKELRSASEAFEKTYVPPPGRMRIIPGLKHTTIIDDTYNSSPAAVEAALETLDVIPAKRRIAVLGDMLELGRFSGEEHRKAGAHAAKAANKLVTVGMRARQMAQAALDAGLRDSCILQYEDSDKAGEELAANLKPGDLVLVKGSQSMRMERIVEALMEHPEKAGELLVRQDAEWKKR